MIEIQTFSKGKTHDKNEDYFGNNKTCFVLADGATDKSGKKYNNKTGGEIVSRMVVKECLKTNLNGVKLVKYLNKKLKNIYKFFKIIKKIKDPKFRFSCSFICVRIVKSNIIITYLGDLGFRINGKQIYQNQKQIDINNANIRSKYIEKTKDINGSRNYIMPLLLKQFKYQNNFKSSFGYGVIDGTHTPKKFIKVFQYNLKKINTIELFSDGYFDIPKKISIDAWEEIFNKIEKEDPYKYKKYKSTKSKDDRTIVIINLKKENS